MTGLLLTNKYAVSNNFETLKNYIFDAAKNNNIELSIYNNVEILNLLLTQKIKNFDFVLFWDKDVKLAMYLESIGLKVFNSSESIRLCDDKSLTYITLLNKNIVQPKTLFSPLIYYHDISEDEEFIDIILSNFNFPFVFKECFGSFGEQVYLINNKSELINRIKACDVWPFIVQEFIEESFGKDLRVYIVGDKIVGAIKRENKSGDFRANVMRGGIASAYSLSEAEKELALKAKNALKLDFCGVDILFGKNNVPILCEVNSNAYFVGLNSELKINVADYIFKYIIGTFKKEHF